MAEENFYHNYTKKELYNLWLDALSYDIKDRRLDKIKHALEETVNLGQYSKDSFIYLIDTLYKLPDTALYDIADGNFSSLYKAYYKHTNGMPEDYTYISELLNAIYRDYKSISNNDEYQEFCKSHILEIKDIYRFNDKIINDSLKKANPHLANLLKNRNNDYDYIKEKFNFDAAYVASSTIENHLMVTFLMNADYYDCDYNLPSNLLNKLIKKLNIFDLIRVAIYMDYFDDSMDLTQKLMDVYYFKSNSIDGINNMIKDNSNIKRLRKSNN